MKASYVVGLVAIAAAGILAGIGIDRSKSAVKGKDDCPTCNRLVTIYQKIDDTCEVNFPVVVVRAKAPSQTHPQTIQWQTESDTPYYINFTVLRHKSGYPPANYQPKSPLRDSGGNVVDNVYVTKNQPSGMYTVVYDSNPSQTPEPNYYFYAIYSKLDPTTNSNNPCKEPYSDHDTGVNVKP
ncbi:MAG TPA: hypothetical protein VG897_15640 [Terriglobales bacterium]|nr:hypothetical protein [Terriglobales bacterium]